MAVKNKAKKQAPAASLCEAKRRGQRYLAIPYHILNLCDIGLSQKVLLAHIYSFGIKGCWQSNMTLGQIFMVSPRMVTRWISDIRGHLYIKSSKGYYRTMWAKSHPEIHQKSSIDLDKSVQHPTQKCRSQLDKSGNRLSQNCPTTNNNTNKEINKEISPLPPLPAGGQASAVLADRKQQMQERIEKFKKGLGIGSEVAPVRMTAR